MSYPDVFCAERHVNMKQRAWKTRIKKACRDAGTYKPYFDHAIDALAGTLAKRDEIAQAYDESGEGPMIEFTNKNGSTNLVKNPLLVMWDDFNKSALTYWRDLGLTPAGLKKINEEAFEKKEAAGNALTAILGRGRDE